MCLRHHAFYSPAHVNGDWQMSLDLLRKTSLYSAPSCLINSEREKWSSHNWSNCLLQTHENFKLASKGFEPTTSGMPVQCSTNWTMKPHDRLLRSQAYYLAEQMVLQIQNTAQVHVTNVVQTMFKPEWWVQSVTDVIIIIKNSVCVTRKTADFCLL